MQNGSETFCIELPLAHKRIETPCSFCSKVTTKTKTKVNAVNILIVFSIAGHVVKHGLDLGLDWTCKPWTGLVKHGLDL